MPDEVVVEDTNLDDQVEEEISEEPTEPIEDGGEEEPEDTGDDNGPEDSSFSDYLDTIDPEEVKQGTFDEEEFERKAAEAAAETPEVEDEPEAHGDGDKGQQEVQGTRIVYKGQEVMIPNDRVTEYLQKGFDYEQKVGPHQRLASLLEQNPDVAAEVETKLIERLSGKPPEDAGDSATGEGFEPDEYVGEQVNHILEKSGIKSELTELRAQKFTGALKSRDGEDGFNMVDGLLKSAMQQQYALGFLTDQQIAEINDPNSGQYVQAYEILRNGLVKSGQMQVPAGGGAPQAPKPTVTRKKKPAQSFRVGSGGGEVSTPRKSVWDRPSAEFEDIIDRVKRGETVTL